jgi:hypothetical protein
VQYLSGEEPPAEILIPARLHREIMEEEAKSKSAQPKDAEGSEATEAESKSAE